MSNNLERFIHKNRRDFDTETPGDNVWENIERSIPITKKEAKRFSLRDIYKWSAAAAIFFIILTSVYFLFIRKYSHEIPIVKNEKPVNTGTCDDVTNIAPEYAAEFCKVSRSIETRQSELRSATAASPALYQQFLKDIAVLDSSYRMLRDQAAQTPNRDVIIKAMMQNLLLQAELLKRQVMISTELNNTKKPVNEKTI